MKRGAGREGLGWSWSGPDGTAAGCGWARNANFVQRPYEAGDGPARPGWSEAAPDGAARGRGTAQNAIFVQRPYEAGRGPGGARGRASGGPHGAFSPNRAATLCNRQGADAIGWAAGRAVGDTAGVAG